MSKLQNGLEQLDTFMIDYLIKKKVLTASSYIEFFNEYVTRHTIEAIVKNILDIYEGFSVTLTNTKQQFQKFNNESDTEVYIGELETKWINANARFIENNLYTLNQENSLELTDELLKYFNKFLTDWQRIYSTNMEKNIQTARNMAEITRLLGGTGEGNNLTTKDDVLIMFETKVKQNLNFVQGYQAMLKGIFKSDFLDVQLETIKKSLKATLDNKILLFEKFESVQENLTQLTKDTVNTNATFEKLPTLSKLDKDRMITAIEEIHKYADTDKEKLLMTFLKKYKVSNENNLTEEVNILLTLTRFKYLSDSKITKDATLYLKAFELAFKRSLKSSNLLIHDFRKEYPFFPFTEKTPYAMYMKMGEIFLEYAQERLLPIQAKQFAKSLQFGLLLDMKKLEGMEQVFEKEIKDFIQNDFTDLFKTAGFDFNSNTKVTLAFLNSLENDNYIENSACFLLDYLKRTSKKSFLYELNKHKGILNMNQLDKGEGNTLSRSTDLKPLELLYLLIEEDYTPISKEEFYSRVSLNDIPRHYIDGTMKNTPMLERMQAHVEYRLENRIYTKNELLAVYNAPVGKINYRVMAVAIQDKYGTQVSDTFQSLLNQCLADGSINMWDSKTFEKLEGISGEVIVKAFETLYPVQEVTLALKIYDDYCSSVAIKKHQFIYQYFKMNHIKTDI